MVALLTAPAGVAASPLDQAACDALKTERSALVAAGIENDLARGPEGAKANKLGAERLKQIERMIEVDEQLSFRCGEAVTARPTLKEPPKPIEAAATPAKKDASAGQAAAPVSPSGEAVPPKKKKKPAAAKAKSKEAAQAAPASEAPVRH